MASVGDETVADCKACKTSRGHVVAAVEDGVAAALVCSYCNKRTTVRKKRAARSGTTTRRKRVTKIPPPPKYEPNPEEAKPYSPAGTFGEGDTLVHPAFGLGVVEMVQIDKKIHVRFVGGVKILVAGRG